MKTHCGVLGVVQVNACSALSVPTGVGVRVTTGGFTIAGGGLVVQSGDVTLTATSLVVSAGNLMVTAGAGEGTASAVDARASAATPNVIYGRVSTGETGGTSLQLLMGGSTLFQARDIAWFLWKCIVDV
jgi:hypothetical protein